MSEKDGKQVGFWEHVFANILSDLGIAPLIKNFFSGKGAEIVGGAVERKASPKRREKLWARVNELPHDVVKIYLKRQDMRQNPKKYGASYPADAEDTMTTALADFCEAADEIDPSGETSKRLLTDFAHYTTSQFDNLISALEHDWFRQFVLRLLGYGEEVLRWALDLAVRHGEVAWNYIKTNWPKVEKALRDADWQVALALNQLRLSQGWLYYPENDNAFWRWFRRWVW